MRIPFVPPIPDVVEMLKLLSNTSVYIQRLTDLKNLQDDLNKQIDTYEKYQDLDNTLAQAKANLVNSEGFRRKADEYAAIRKAAADADYAAQMDQVQRARDESRNLAKELADRAAKLEDEARALNEQWKQLTEEKKQVALLRSDVDAAKTAADKARAVYEDKLRQIKAVAEE